MNLGDFYIFLETDDGRQAKMGVFRLGRDGGIHWYLGQGLFSFGCMAQVRLRRLVLHNLQALKHKKREEDFQRLKEEVLAIW